MFEGVCMKKIVRAGPRRVDASSASSLGRPAPRRRRRAPGLVSSILNKMDRNRRDARARCAPASAMQKYNAQIRDEDNVVGRRAVHRRRGPRRQRPRRLDASPRRRCSPSTGGQYTLYRPRLNMAYKGSTKTGVEGRQGEQRPRLRPQHVEARRPRTSSTSSWSARARSTTAARTSGGSSSCRSGNAGYQFAEIWVTTTACPSRLASPRRTATRRPCA